VARFTAPSVPARVAADDLLTAHAWRALGPWQYVAGPNLYRASVEPLYPLIVSGQAAVRAAERRGCPQTVAAVDKALCDLPVDVMDDQADRILHAALRALSLAEDAEEWTLVADVEQTVSALLHQPDGATIHHPAVLAVVTLAARATFVHQKMIEGSAERAAWERAYLLGLEALRAITSAVYGEEPGPDLDTAVTRFLTAVRRAIPYAALIATRYALVEAARTYGIFVIGMRQPMPSGSRWEWARCIGDAVYLFEVEPPLMGGAPYGAVAVRRTTTDGTAEPVRYFPLGADQERGRAVTEALHRI
jgi:hypothetical protein